MGDPCGQRGSWVVCRVERNRRTVKRAGRKKFASPGLDDTDRSAANILEPFEQAIAIPFQLDHMLFCVLQVVAGLASHGCSGFGKFRFDPGRLNADLFLLVSSDTERRRPLLRFLPLQEDTREEAGEMVVIVLRVPFKRVIVAACATNAGS